MIVPPIRVRRIGEHTLPVPSRATELAAGYDLRSAPHNVTLAPGPEHRLWLPCGFAFAIPPGYEGHVRPRSGLAFNHGVVLFIDGTIDGDYRGEVKVGLVNYSGTPFKIEHGDRIAQMVVTQVLIGDMALVDDLDETTRGAGGFGSTGVK